MKDELFIRGKVPMTKSEVRAVSISKLELTENAILYDIGAGTGSVSVEASFLLKNGFVYAIEQKEEAVQLIKENKEKFHASNITIIHGKAPEAMKTDRVPTHAFIGGSSGNLKEIILALLDKNKEVRIVLNVIALESLAQAITCLKELAIEAEIVQVQVSRGNLVGNYHLMQGLNPVFVISFGGVNL